MQIIAERPPPPFFFIKGLHGLIKVALMNILICETEPSLGKHLTTLITLLGHEVVGLTNRLDEAYKLTLQYHPEIVLINAHLPHTHEFTQKLSDDLTAPPAFIFFGLDDSHLLLNAFKCEASDYLLIPVHEKNLHHAIQKCTRINAAQEQALSKQDEDNPRTRQYIAARTHRGVELISLADVYYFTADQKYVKVRHKGGVVLIDETLKDLEEEFSGMMFRIHRNALINLSYLDLLETVDSGQYRVRFRGMSETLSVSRRHLPTLREKIQNI